MNHTPSVCVCRWISVTARPYLSGVRARPQDKHCKVKVCIHEAKLEERKKGEEKPLMIYTVWQGMCGSASPDS